MRHGTPLYGQKAHKIMTEPTPLPPRTRRDEDPIAVLESINAQYAWRNMFGTLGLGLVVGVAVAWWLIPTYLTSMIQSMTGDQPKVFWYVSRSAGVIAYLLLWLSMVWGLLLTTTIAKRINKVAPIVDLHRHFSILTVVFTLAHVVVLVGDRYANFSLAVLFVPFIGDGPAYRPYAMALGQIATYLLVGVTLSFWVRTWISQTVWRIVHYLSFVSFVGVAIHALLHVTHLDALFWMYATTTVSTLFLSVFRLLTSATRAPAPATPDMRIE